jgi:nicotinic acid mononucleotide adenylyltransferase
MKSYLDISEVARSIELFNLGREMQQKNKENKSCLEFIREPFLRNRKYVETLVVAFGSYDPLSRAHESLFLRGLDVARKEKNNENNNKNKTKENSSLDELLIVTSTTHFDKKIDLTKNSTIYDRIHSLEGFASCYKNVSLALFNQPLFIDLAKAINEKYSSNVKIHFVVGSDVMEKIVDVKNYDDYDEYKYVLTNLFENKFIVSQREIDTNEGKKIVGVDELIEKYSVLSNYKNNLIAINLDGKYKGLKIPIEKVSSTLIRNKRSEQCNARSLEALGISDFIDKRDLYIKDNLSYAAFTSARERFAIENSNKPLSSYIVKLMNYLNQLHTNTDLQKKEVENYTQKSRITTNLTV